MRRGKKASFYCFAFSVSRVRNENTEEQRSQYLMTAAFRIIGDRTVGEENVHISNIAKFKLFSTFFSSCFCTYVNNKIMNSQLTD